MSGWPDAMYDGYRPEPVWRTKEDALLWLDLTFGAPHIFSTLTPPTCEVCGGSWPDVDASLKERCEGRRAA